MEFHKVAQDISDIFRSADSSFVFWLCGLLRISKTEYNNDASDLGDTPGDNVLPEGIMVHLSSRRSL